MTTLAVYWLGCFALFAWMAAINQHDARQTFVCVVFWPLTLTILGLAYLFARNLWHFDINPTPPNLSRVGFRRPTSHKVTGFAFRFYGTELQFWKCLD